ncbi:hypothetical protein GCM10009119_06620 [Algoriphagus jejuensis]|uniref:YbbR-like protein n=1 Tax=Algoriphagus jejuensis TaxID=419934 RepID=A0ABN1MXC4_9BACT
MPEHKKSSGWISSRKLSNLKVVVLCIAAATTFWILNALNKDNYNTIVDYPIQWDFDQDEYMAVQPLPESVPIQISGNGWDLLRKYFKLNETPFVINLAEPATKSFILTSDLKRPLGDFITPTTLIGMLRDSIRYHIDPIEILELEPVLDTTGFSLAKNVEIEGPVLFNPAKVSVKGPSSILETFDGKFLISLSESRISQNFSKSVSLEIDEELKDFVSLEHEDIEVNFSVIQYLEGNKRLKLKKVNFPNSVVLEDEEITPLITYLIDGSKVTELKDMEFEAILDYSKRNRKDSTIAITVKPNPSYIKEMRVEPSFVRLKYE